MDIIKVNKDNVSDTILNTIKNQEEKILYMVGEEDCVFTSLRDNFNYQYCKDNNIHIYHLKNMGGVIVSSKGDIQLAHFSKNLKNQFMKSISEKLLEFLKSKGLNAIISENDILVDGYKVCGYASVIYDKLIYSVFQISINTNIKHIENICLKPMNKIPKGLSEFGVRTEDLLEFLLTELENYSDKTEAS